MRTIAFSSMICFLFLMVIAAAPIHAGSRLELAAAGGATLELSTIVIRKKADQVNLRIVVHNTGSVMAAALAKNLTLYLFVKDEAGKWKELQHWNNIESLKPGEKVARDYIPVDAPPEFGAEEFSVKAELKLAFPGRVEIRRASLEKLYPRDAIIEP